MPTEKIFKSLFRRLLILKASLQRKKNTCPICNVESVFLPFGVILRERAQCPVCFSLERHRFFFLLLQKMNIFKEKNVQVLHFAPEKCFEEKFEKLWGKKYITMDLFDPNVKIIADIKSIPFKKATFDYVFCSHVLEHIEDDVLAIQEIKRVLKKTGKLFIMVPIEGKKTIEDPSITTPEGRLAKFGQKDHVRIYGLDIVQRLRKVGLHIKIINAKALASSEEMSKFAALSSLGTEILIATIA